MARLTIEAIGKRFGAVEALSGVSLTFRPGEVTALVGDNGAGKTTLIKILSGVLRPDRGTLTIDGRRYPHLTTRQALELGISTVYQDLALGNTCSVVRNIFLGDEISRAGFLCKQQMKAEAERLLSDLSIQIPSVETNVGALSGGQRQGVAVARIVRRGGSILIFDEPTAAMGASESARVLKLIRRLADRGFTLIMISHNLPQVFSIADRIVVLRRGAVAGDFPAAETNQEEVVAAITGRFDVGEGAVV